MPKLGLGTGIGRAIVHTPGVVTDGLVMKHMYPAGAVQPLSDGAVYTDGSGHVNMGDNGDRGTGDLSVGCWFYAATNTTHGAGLVTKQLNYNADAIGFGLYYRPSNTKIYFNIGDSSDGSRTDYTIGMNQWIHVVGTYQQSTGKNFLYVNGVKVTSSTQSGLGTLDNSENLKIGHAGEYFKGYITNAFLYSDNIGSDTIKSIMWKQYTDLTSDETSGLISWWDLDEDAQDSHGGIHGALSGTV